MAVLMPDKKCLILLIKFFFGLSTTQQAIIRDQWRHLELMEPHWKYEWPIGTAKCGKVVLFIATRSATEA